MLLFVLNRLIQAAFVLLLAVTAVFFLIRLSGDPVLLYLPPDATREQIDAFRIQLGFDQPLLVQYLDFMKNALSGDFGTSLRRQTDALSLVIERLPATFLLAISALTLSLAIALPVGMLAARYAGGLFDRLVVGLAVILDAMPGFWLGLILVLIFSVTFRLLPTSGSGTLAHLVLPTVTLATYSLARFVRFTRSAMVDVLRQNYIRTARASGASGRRILGRYALRNALIPLITLAGLDLGTMLGGAVIAETIFAWPGLGRLIMESLLARDFPVVIAGVFVIAAMFSLINCLVDILYGFVNPQIRQGGKA